MDIKIKRLTEEEKKKAGIEKWPVWEKEESEFNWHYDENEDCFIIEGEVEVETKIGKTVKFGAGDFVSFPKGMNCRWKIKKAVRKHYNFR